MSSSGAGTWPWSRNGLGMVRTESCLKSRASMKRRFDGGAGSWLPRWWTARWIECGCRVVADHGRKKCSWRRRHHQGHETSSLACQSPPRRQFHSKDLTIVATLLELVEPETAGDPMTGQIWVRSSLRSLRDRLEAVGHPVSAPTVGRLLKDLDYALHVNAKKREASSNHPDRDRQFDYIAVQRATFTAAGLPILSIDSKKSCDT